MKFLFYFPVFNYLVVKMELNKQNYSNDTKAREQQQIDVRSIKRCAKPTFFFKYMRRYVNMFV